MICYDRFWKTLEERGITQYRLIKEYHFSAGQIGRMKKNMHVSTHTIDVLCGIIGCGVEDIMEFVPEEGQAVLPPLSELPQEKEDSPAQRKKKSSKENKKTKKKEKSEKEKAKKKKKK